MKYTQRLWMPIYRLATEHVVRLAATSETCIHLGVYFEWISFFLSSFARRSLLPFTQSSGSPIRFMHLSFPVFPSFLKNLFKHQHHHHHHRRPCIGETAFFTLFHLRKDNAVNLNVLKVFKCIKSRVKHLHGGLFKFHLHVFFSFAAAAVHSHADKRLGTAPMRAS